MYVSYLCVCIYIMLYEVLSLVGHGHGAEKKRRVPLYTYEDDDDVEGALPRLLVSVLRSSPPLFGKEKKFVFIPSNARVRVYIYIYIYIYTLFIIIIILFSSFLTSARTATAARRALALSLRGPRKSNISRLRKKVK